MHSVPRYYFFNLCVALKCLPRSCRVPLVCWVEKKKKMPHLCFFPVVLFDIDMFTKVDFLVFVQDLHTIYCHLYHMDVLSHLREHQLRSVIFLLLCPKFKLRLNVDF